MYICIIYNYIYIYSCISILSRTQITQSLHAFFFGKRSQKSWPQDLHQVWSTLEYTLVFQNPPNTLWGGVWNPERPSQEVFGGPNTYSQGIWKTTDIGNDHQPCWMVIRHNPLLKVIRWSLKRWHFTCKIWLCENLRHPIVIPRYAMYTYI